MGDGTVRIEGLSKQFGSLIAVDNLTFTIDDGEFFTFLGPSGCGKTTTLRMLAGFENLTEGTIHIGGEEISDRPPYERDVGMVFQSYALFPHKTVAGNVGFGLRMEGVSEEEREARVAEVLEMVDLPGFQDRSPTELSGGQQQRVALARALVIQPDVLLLDEPLANLDLKLRQQMRFELQRIQDELGITTLYVTHDQQEALSMSDRILVMNDGHGEQIDSPTRLYNDPENEFVADFIGETNLLEGRVAGVRASDTLDVTLDATNEDYIASGVSTDNIGEGDDVILNIRPEDIRLAPGHGDGLMGQVEAKTFYGRVTTYLINVDGQEVLVDSFGRGTQAQFESGDAVTLNWDNNNCLVLNA